MGDYQRNSDLQYMGQLGQLILPDEVSYDNIRRGLWQYTDFMYKYNLQANAQKTQFLTANPLPADEAVVPDMQQLPAVTKIEARTRPLDIDIPALECLAAEVSAVFKDYKELYNSSVVFDGNEMDIYRLTTESVKLKQPQGVINYNISASVRAADGSVLRKGLSDSFLSTDDLPSADTLKAQVRRFAEDLLALKDAPVINEFYTGPVLLENGAAAKLFIDHLMPPGRLIAARTLMPAPGMLDQQLGRKVIDPRLTVKNYSSLAEYNGTSLFGCYETDADGITPAKELILIEKGILKQLLNGRIPTLKTPRSTGSTRFMNNPSSPVAITSVGTLHVQAVQSPKSTA